MPDAFTNPIFPQPMGWPGLGPLVPLPGTHGATGRRDSSKQTQFWPKPWPGKTLGLAGGMSAGAMPLRPRRVDANHQNEPNLAVARHGGLDGRAWRKVGWGGGMYHGKPILGIIGGIGSGKSYVAKRFGELGLVVIDSDRLVHEAYARPEIRAVLLGWWGPSVFNDDGSLNRRAVAKRVFGDDMERQRLEAFIHPVVTADRDRIMAAEVANPGVLGFVWDTPLLMETGANDRCDAVVFVDTPLAMRLARVATRGWSQSDLLTRENLQMPLDKKRSLADYVLSNAADENSAREQASTIFSSIQAKCHAAELR